MNSYTFISTEACQTRLCVYLFLVFQGYYLDNPLLTGVSKAAVPSLETKQ